MGLHTSPCVACGVLDPDFGHHFWLCTVARAVRREVEHQLVAHGMLPAGSAVSCAALWLGVKPHARLSTWVWDLVCVAALHALDVGRSAAWAVSRRLEVAALVDVVASRAAAAAFWSALADFAATTPIPRGVHNVALTQQPFLAWHVVVARGSGLRVMRR
jgi:hypothetical protein